MSGTVVSIRKPEATWHIELASRIAPNTVNVAYWPTSLAEVQKIAEDFGGLGAFALRTDYSENLTTRVQGVEITIYLSDVPQERERDVTPLARYLGTKIEEAS